MTTVSIDRVVAGPTKQSVAAESPHDDVAAVQTTDHVSATKALDDVVAVGTQDHVVTFGRIITSTEIHRDDLAITQWPILTRHRGRQPQHQDS